MCPAVPLTKHARIEQRHASRTPGPKTPPQKRYSNASGTEVVPDDGPSPGGLIPRSSKQRLFYALLWAHLSKAHGYVPGRDLFYVPYDWRIGVQGLEQVGGVCGGGVC